MAKRKTREQRRQEQYEALRRRVCDIMTGATGTEVDDDGFSLILPDLWRVVTAVSNQLLKVDGEIPDGRKYLTNHACLEYFETVDKLTDHLFDAGIRA